MSAEFTVRFPVRRDLEGMARVAPPGTGEADLVRFLGRRGTRGWVAEDAAGGVAGYLLVDEPDGPELVVAGLAVAPAARGCAERLLERAAEYNRKAAGKAELAAYVPYGDVATARLFAGLGFAPAPAGDRIRFSRPE